MAEMYANQLSGTYDKDKAKEMAEYMAENGGGGVMERDTKASYSQLSGSIEEFVTLSATLAPQLAMIGTLVPPNPAAATAPMMIQSLKTQASSLKMLGMMLLQGIIKCGTVVPKAFITAIKTVATFINTLG